MGSLDRTRELLIQCLAAMGRLCDDRPFCDLAVVVRDSAEVTSLSLLSSLISFVFLGNMVVS